MPSTLGIFVSVPVFIEVRQWIISWLRLARQLFINFSIGKYLFPSDRICCVLPKCIVRVSSLYSRMWCQTSELTGRYESCLHWHLFRILKMKTTCGGSRSLGMNNQQPWHAIETDPCLLFPLHWSVNINWVGYWCWAAKQRWLPSNVILSRTTRLYKQFTRACGQIRCDRQQSWSSEVDHRTMLCLPPRVSHPKVE